MERNFIQQMGGAKVLEAAMLEAPSETAPVLEASFIEGRPGPTPLQAEIQANNNPQRRCIVVTEEAGGHFTWHYMNRTKTMAICVHEDSAPTAEDSKQFEAMCLYRYKGRDTP